MLLTDDQATRINGLLRATRPFAKLPATNQRPMNTTWQALNDTLMSMRLPLYHRSLRKPVPTEKVYEAAVQNGLALLGAFAATLGTKQAIVSSRGRWIDRISFQPRPDGMNWNAAHAISPEYLVQKRASDPNQAVSLEDFLFMAAKTTYVVARRSAGAIPDITATFAFDVASDGAPTVDGVVREHGAQTHNASLLPLSPFRL
jgi:hypothetical protein